METSEKVRKYIEKHSKWAPKLKLLRSVFTRTELTETVKWGVPTYTLDGKLVAGFAAFKNHFAIWFHQGVFLNDPGAKLSNAQEGVTRAMRQWKFEKDDQLDSELIYSYLLEATANCKAGKYIKPQRRKGTVAVPEEMQKALEADTALEQAFKSLTPGRRREYSVYIQEAKLPATKKRRLEKILPLIAAGKGLNDRYRKK